MLGMQAPAQPVSDEEWQRRQKMLRDLGFADDGLLMRGTEWKRGLSADREAWRSETKDALRQKLGLSAADTATKAAGAAGSSSLLSSL